MAEFVEVWRRATAGELAWVDAEGMPGALTAVPLLDRGCTAADGCAAGVPCVALTYDRAAAAASLAGASTVAFAVTDARSVRAGVVAFGRVTLTHDLDGVAEDLLLQELRTYPPARALADSPLLRRENWWYLPRIVVRLDRIDRTHPLPPRREPARDALIVRDDGRGLRLDVASSPDWSGASVALHADGLRGDGAPALAHGHDHTPDRERWAQWSVRGTLRGETLHVSGREGRPGLPRGAPGLLERLRRARALEKACRQGIAAAEA